MPLGLGLGLTKDRASAIPYGSGLAFINEAAILAAFPVGTLVYDVEEAIEVNRTKRINIVANLDGADTVNFGFILPANGTTGPWELEWLMAVDGMPTSLYQPFISMVGTNSTQHWRVQIDPSVANAISSVWRTAAGASLSSRRAYGFLDGRFHKHRVEVSSDLKGRYFVDGIQQEADAELSTWTPGAPSSFRITGSAASGTKTFTKIANMRVSRGGVEFAYIPFSDGTGATVTDKSGNGYHGIITDVSPINFWQTACIPISKGG